MSSSQPPVTNAPKFFVDHKKGEVVELLNLLTNPNTDRDPVKKKDVIKRVIAYMTSFFLTGSRSVFGFVNKSKHRS